MKATEPMLPSERSCARPEPVCGEPCEREPAGE
jgi:hypothetical protein